MRPPGYGVDKHACFCAFLALAVLRHVSPVFGLGQVFQIIEPFSAHLSRICLTEPVAPRCRVPLVAQSRIATRKGSTIWAVGQSVCPAISTPNCRAEFAPVWTG